MEIIYKLIITVVMFLVGGYLYLYFYFELIDEIKLHKFRKNLSSGNYVIIDNGKDIFKAMITTVSNGTVRVIKADGKTSAYGIKCVYPLNYVVNDTDIESSNLH